jgi:WD40 repeat protein
MNSAASHPDPQQLRSCGLGLVDPAEMESLFLHLESCPACRRIVEATSDDRFTAIVRQLPPPGKDLMTSGPAPPTAARTPGWTTRRWLIGSFGAAALGAGVAAWALFSRRSSWDGKAAAEGDLVRTIPDCGGAVVSAALTGDGRRAVAATTGRPNGEIALWDLDSGARLRRLTAPGGGPTGTTWSVAVQGDRVLTGGDDRLVRLWNLTTGAELLRLEDHREQIRSVAISSDGRYALSGGGGRVYDGRPQRGKDHVVRLWDLQTGKILRSLDEHSHTVRCTAFSADGRRALTAGQDDLICIWDVSSGALLKHCRGHTNWVVSAAFSPNSSRVVSGGLDETVRLWDVGTGVELRSFKADDEATAHRRAVHAVAFCSDGRGILSGSVDGSLKLWHAANGECLHIFTGRSDPVNCVAVDAAGRTALSGGGDAAGGSKDATLRLWRLPQIDS